MTAVPEQGSLVEFKNGDEVLAGRVVGEAVGFSTDEGVDIVLVPVYVREKDKHIYVNTRNFV